MKAFDGYYDPASKIFPEILDSSLIQPILDRLSDCGDEFLLCPLDTESYLLNDFSKKLGMDEAVIIALDNMKEEISGLLIAGNTQEMLSYQSRIKSDSLCILGLANLVSQVSTVIQNLESYQTLEQERQLLEEKVSQLVKTELQLYTIQEELDRQISIYRNLYEVGQHLSTVFDLDKIFESALEFILYKLNFQRSIILLESEENDCFEVKYYDGFYDESNILIVENLILSKKQSAIQSILHDLNHIIYDPECVDVDLGHLRHQIGMDEYFIFPLNNGSEKTNGLLIVGNTAEMATFHTRVNQSDECLLGLSNFVSQLTTAMATINSYNTLNLYQQKLEQKNHSLEHTVLELKKAQSQLIQSEKMSSVGQLVAGVAHEINNPVSFIYGNIAPAREYVQNLLDLVALYQSCFPSPPEIIQETLDAIDLDFLSTDLPLLLNSMQTGANRIKDIVLSLRTFSRKDEAEKKSVDLHAGIESTLMILQNRLKIISHQTEIKVIRNYGDLPLVECYAGQLNQVFMNLLANALDALEEYSYKISDRPLYIKISTHTDGSSVYISIADNGPGISQKHLNQLYNPFFTTKPVGKGTGLGLAISYDIVTEKHGGSLDCHSTVGKGTEFSIRLPLMSETLFERGSPLVEISGALHANAPSCRLG